MSVRGFLAPILFAVLAAPPASAQVSVTTPAAGAAASYRKAVIQWNPIPGASTYHLEVDDDPNFGSPEVDVTVPGTSYALSGETLRLNGQVEWAAYVRINGVRWNAGTFTPSYFQGVVNPAIATDSTGRLHLAFLHQKVHITSSDDWAARRLLSLEDTFNPHGLDVAVDEHDVVHTFWAEQRDRGAFFVPFYSNSATGWQRVVLPGSVTGSGGIGGSLLVEGGRIDVFHDMFGEGIQRFTSADGVAFDVSRLANTDGAYSASAARDAAGEIYLVSEHLPGDVISLRRSSEGWLPHSLGQGRWPTVAVGSAGDVHLLRREYGPGFFDSTLFYTNSARGFSAWTQLPVTATFNGQDLFPLVLDEARGALHVASNGGNGPNLCSSHDLGENWDCRLLGQPAPIHEADHPDLALGPDGTLHVAWAEYRRNDRAFLGYANSLGSFLVANFAPEVVFGAPIPSALAVTLPTVVRDQDEDVLAGTVQVGRYEDRTVLLAPGAQVALFGGTLVENVGNVLLQGADFGLELRPLDGFWSSRLFRVTIPAFPATIEVRSPSAPEDVLGSFVIESWGESGVTIRETMFATHAQQAFGDRLPVSIAVAGLPEGSLVLRVTATDGPNVTEREQVFTRTAPQATLFLSGLDGLLGAVGDAIDGVPPEGFNNPNNAGALYNKLAVVERHLREAMDEVDADARRTLLDSAKAKLQNDLLGKSDGCATSGAPDANDWILTCAGQQPFYTAVQNLIAFIDAL